LILQFELILQLFLCRERENQKTIKKFAILGVVHSVYFPTTIDRIGSILKEIGFRFLFVNLKL